MNVLKKSVCAALFGAGSLVALAAGATTVTMNFDQLDTGNTASTGQYVDQYYNGGCGGSYHPGITPPVPVNCGGPSDGVVWKDAVAFGSSSPLFTNPPSSPNVLVVKNARQMTMNVAAGFVDNLSFYYSASNANGKVKIYSGADGTGDLLASMNLAKNSGISRTCSASLCIWDLVSMNFAGNAMSAVFFGGANNLGIDNVSFTMAQAPAQVPEPSALGVFGLGALLAGGFVALRRRQSTAE